MSNPHSPGDVEEMRKLLDRLNQVDPKWHEKLLDDFSAFPDPEQRAVTEAFQIIVRHLGLK